MQATLPLMGKKKQPNDDKKDKLSDGHRRPAIPLRFADERIDEAIRQLAKENVRSLTGEITLAVIEHLKKYSKWPLPSADEAEES